MGTQKKSTPHPRQSPLAGAGGAEPGEAPPASSGPPAPALSDAPEGRARPLILSRYAPSCRVIAAHDPDDRRTQSEFFRDTNIHILLERFQTPEHIPQVAASPLYGDFTGLDDYRDAVERVRDADEAFAALPSSVREELEHDPGQLVELVNAHEAGNPNATQWFRDREFYFPSDLDERAASSEGLPVAAPAPTPPLKPLTGQTAPLAPAEASPGSAPPAPAQTQMAAPTPPQE